MSIDEIDQLIDNFMFKHLISDEGIILHIGPGNVRMENGEYHEYDYINTQPIGSRTPHEQNHIIILNEMMYIMHRLKTYIYTHNPSSKPIESKSMLDVIEDHNDEDDQQSIRPIQEENVESLMDKVNDMNMNDI